MSVLFSSRKTILKSWLDTSSTPTRYLAICRAFQAFFYHNPDNSSIPGGSIENAPASSIASRHLVDRSSFCSWIWFLVSRYLLDTSAVNKHFSQHLPRAIRFLFHSISLSIAFCFLSQTLSSHSNHNPRRFLQAFSSFSSLGKLLISHSSCISCFHVLGFFKILELFLKFWDRFSLKWV